MGRRGKHPRFLDSGNERSESSASLCFRFILRGIIVRYETNRRPGGPRSGQEAKRTISAFAGNRTPVVQPLQPLCLQYSTTHNKYF
jgi:hypothetical protein